MAKKKRILVTGANGFIGSLLVQRLNNDGYKIISIIQKGTTFTSSIKTLSEAVFELDLLSDNINYIFTQFKIDVVVHLAWAGVNGDLKGKEEIQNNNIAMSLKIADTASLFGTKTFIALGTISEKAYLFNKDVLSPSLTYGKYKHLCYEKLNGFFKGTDTNFFWLQMANLYGETNKTGNLLSYEINTILSGNIPSFGPCNQYYDFLFVDDAIQAILSFISTNKKTDNTLFYIGSGKPKLLKEFLLIVSKSISQTAKIDIGHRQSDGMIFKKEFFDIRETKDFIGDSYISDSFENHVKKMINIIKTDKNNVIQ